MKENDFAYIKPKPFVKWAGGKGQLSTELKRRIPRGELSLKKYAEPMVGGGALFFEVVFNHGFENFYIGDTNRELINAYRIIQNRSKDLIAELREMQQRYTKLAEDERKDFYYRIRDEYNATDLKSDTSLRKAACFIFLNKTCFNGLYRVNSKGMFNVPFGLQPNPMICDEANLRMVSEALKGVEIVCGDYSFAKDFIDENTFAYFDPPYRPVSPTAAFTAYNSDVFDDNEQKRLAEFLREISKKGATVLSSNSDSKFSNGKDDFFDKLYDDFNISRVEAKRMINSVAERRGKVGELLIYNRDDIMNRDFNAWINTFKANICDYGYYMNFEKPYRNVDKIKVELNILNSLIGSENIEAEFESLITEYPQTLKCIPILLAVRTFELYVADKDGEYIFDFNRLNHSVSEYSAFMKKTGLFELISKRIIGNLVDYVLGVEVGLESNGRKNRGGRLMEMLVENYIVKAGLTEGETYFKEMPLSDICRKWGVDMSALNGKKADKRFDFVIKGRHTVYGIETNFYTGGGSKLNETARSYKTLALEAKDIRGFEFIWITDGYGWKSARRNLEETFDVLDNLYCINDLENGVISELLKK